MKKNWKDSFKKCWFDWFNGKLDVDGSFGFDVTFNQGIYLKGRTSQIDEMCQEVIGMTPHTIKFNKEWDEFTDEIYYVCVCYFDIPKEIDFDFLVVKLTEIREQTDKVLDGLKFNLNRDTLEFRFSPKELPGCMVLDDWERFYKFDAAKDYENPSEFVAECMIEECLNKIELEEAYNDVIDKLIEKYK